MNKLITALALGVSLVSTAYASCQNPAPRAQPFVVPSGQGCPSNYSQSGTTCTPSGSARFVFLAPSGQSCPSNYSQQGRMCVASASACYAFVGSGSCPSGYSSQGQICVAN